MSVTITISNNHKYVEEHCPESIIWDTDDTCLCVIDEPHKDCHICNGTGKLPYKYGNYPFELNIANRNFETLWSALDIDTNDTDIHPMKLITSVKKLIPELVERKQGWHNGKSLANTFDRGVDSEQVSRYINELTTIANEALRREDQIVWG